MVDDYGMTLENSAELLVQVGELGFRFGSAYRVGPSILLSAWHVLFGKPDEPPITPQKAWVRFSGSPVSVLFEVKVVWQDADSDVVLLRMLDHSNLRPCKVVPIRADKIRHEHDDEMCSFTSYPLATKLPDKDPAKAARRSTWSPKAKLKTRDYANVGRIAIYLVDPLPSPRELIEGVCGAAVFHENQIVGVLTEFPDSFDRVALAREVWHLLKQADFREEFFKDSSIDAARGVISMVYRATQRLSGKPEERFLEVLEKMGVSPFRLARIRELLESTKRN